jgi:hypothetical protein
VLQDAIGVVLPSAVAVALSPFPVVGVILVLGSSRARTSGVAFASGWLVGLGVLSAIVLALADGADDPSSSAATGVGWVELILGLGLLALAAKKWRSRPPPDAEVEMPRWMAGLDDVAPGRALVLGLALGGANPKNMALTIAAAASIAETGVEGADAFVAVAVYVLLGSVTVLGAVLYKLLRGERAEAGLRAVRDFMTRNNAVIVMVVLVVFGAKLVGDALVDLG